MICKLQIETKTDNRIVIKVVREGIDYEVDINLDVDDDGGITAEIRRNDLEIDRAFLEWT